MPVPVVKAVARTKVENMNDACPVLLMKVTVWAAAGSGATVARAARTARATLTRAGNRGGTRCGVGE